MSEQHIPSELEEQWTAYLEKRGHKVTRPSKASSVALCSKSQGKRYRWILLSSEEPARRLTAIEHEVIKRQMDHAMKSGQEAYLVIKFEKPTPKVIVLPACKAAKAGRLHSDKGGIPWE